MLIRTLALSSIILFSGAAWAGPDCTEEPKSKWLPPAEVLSKAMKEVTEMKLFKVTSGNCYEIYGWNANGDKLEIYYHPVTGEAVKRGSW
ncbi:MAG: PepSY domain-containing protein [Pseudomonadota bacterium]